MITGGVGQLMTGIQMKLSPHHHVPCHPLVSTHGHLSYRDSAGSMSLLEDVNSSPTVQVSNIIILFNLLVITLRNLFQYLTLRLV